MIVDTHEPIQIQGSGVWQQLKLNFADTQVRLANGIQTVQTRLAERGTETQIIRDTTLGASSDTSSTSTKKVHLVVAVAVLQRIQRQHLIMYLSQLSFLPINMPFWVLEIR